MRPPGPADKRFASLYLFAACRPGTDEAFALALPQATTEAMNVFLAGFARQLEPGTHAVLLLDQAGAIVAMFVCLKFFADWAQPAVWGTTTDMGGRNAATLFALVNTSGSVAGFVAGPVMGGTIDFFGRGSTDNSAGWTALFVGIGFVYLASALSWLFVDCTQSIDPADQAAPAAAGR